MIDKAPRANERSLTVRQRTMNRHRTRTTKRHSAGRNDLNCGCVHVNNLSRMGLFSLPPFGPQFQRGYALLDQVHRSHAAEVVSIA